MSRDGNGVYNLPVNSWNPAVDGNAATTVDWQSLIDDVATALTQSVSSDGQTPMTGDLNMNGNRIESLAAGTSTTDAANVGQIYNQGVEQDVASAATTDIGIINSNFIRITGTTTINSLGTNYRGPKFVRFSAALVLTHNATTLILPGGANITTSAGDRAIFVPKGNPSDGWICVAYQTQNNLGYQSARNKLINSNFQINQRLVSGTVVLSASAYGHDRWKAGASGCTYTFATSNGKTTLTISAGSLQQVIASENVPVGTNTCVLSWEGTAQGKIGAGSYGASGVTGSVTGGSNLTIEFNTGTLAVPQFELGSFATAYEQKTSAQDTEDCLYYFERLGVSGSSSVIFSGFVRSATEFRGVAHFQKKRTAPSITIPGTSRATVGSGTFTGTASATDITTNRSLIVLTTAGMTIGQGGYLFTNSAEYYDISAEL